MVKGTSPIWISGIAGSGKTTCALWLKDQLKFSCFSTGDYARNLASRGDAGCVKALIAGKLAPIEYELRTHIKGIATPKTIIDGFPRSKSQYDWIIRNYQCPIIIVLGISRWAARDRLSKRGREGGEVIDKRITNEILDFVDEDFVTCLNAEQPIEKVCLDVLKFVELLIK